MPASAAAELAEPDNTFSEELTRRRADPPPAAVSSRDVAASYRLFAANKCESMEIARFPTHLIGGESVVRQEKTVDIWFGCEVTLHDPLVAGSNPARPTKYLRKWTRCFSLPGGARFGRGAFVKQLVPHRSWIDGSGGACPSDSNRLCRRHRRNVRRYSLLTSARDHKSGHVVRPPSGEAASGLAARWRRRDRRVGTKFWHENLTNNVNPW